MVASTCICPYSLTGTSRLSLCICSILGPDQFFFCFSQVFNLRHCRTELSCFFFLSFPLSFLSFFFLFLFLFEPLIFDCLQP